MKSIVALIMIMIPAVCFGQWEHTLNAELNSDNSLIELSFECLVSGCDIENPGNTVVLLCKQKDSTVYAIGSTNPEIMYLGWASTEGMGKQIHISGLTENAGVYEANFESIGQASYDNPFDICYRFTSVDGSKSPWFYDQCHFSGNGAPITVSPGEPSCDSQCQVSFSGSGGEGELAISVSDNGSFVPLVDFITGTNWGKESTNPGFLRFDPNGGCSDVWPYDMVFTYQWQFRESGTGTIYGPFDGEQITDLNLCEIDPSYCVTPHIVSSSIENDLAVFSASVEADYCSYALFKYRINTDPWVYLNATDSGYIHSVNDIDSGGLEGDDIDVAVELYNCDNDCVGDDTVIGTFTIQTPAKYYRSIVVPSTLVDADISKFPVAVEFIDPTLKSASNGGHVYYENGNDIRFALSSSYLSSIPFEIEKYDPATGYILAWVSADLSSSKSTTFYMHYGDSVNSANDYDLDNLWLNYSFVMHMETEDVFTTNNDVTIEEEGTGFTRTSSGALAGAQYFDGSGSIKLNGVNISDTLEAGTEGLTIEALTWMTTGSSGGYNVILHHTNTTPNQGIDYIQITSGNSHNDYSLRNASFGSPRPYDTESAANSVPLDTWNFLCGVFSSSLSRADTYVNGALTSSDNAASAPNACATSFGRIGDDGRDVTAPEVARWTGMIDELRFAKKNMSTGYISTQWNNYNDTSAFAVVGSEK